MLHLRLVSWGAEQKLDHIKKFLHSFLDIFAYFSSHQNVMKGNSQNYSIIVLVSQTYVLTTDNYTSTLNNER